jgi:hypothetical protein
MVESLEGFIGEREGKTVDGGRCTRNLSRHQQRDFSQGDDCEMGQMTDDGEVFGLESPSKAVHSHRADFPVHLFTCSSDAFSAFQVASIPGARMLACISRI